MSAKIKGAWTQLGKEKLLSSGITSAEAEKLGMYETVSAALHENTWEARPGLVIPYFDIDKKPLAPRPEWPPFFRLRYLGSDPADDWKKATGEKPKRYVQPPRSGVCAYFPRVTDWQTIAKDPEHDIIITEGELKASAACLHGFPTIGLGGVYNFRSSKDGIWFLPELVQFNWRMRDVYICFDSDYLSNPNVCSAINSLCTELEERGAYVRLLALPEGDGGVKQGLDDYLLANHPDQLAALIKEAEPLGISRSLWAINNEVVYVEDPGLVLVDDTLQKLSADQFKGHSRWATLSATETTVSTKGTISRDKVAAGPAWIKWPLRRSAKKLTYAPGQPRLTSDGLLNQWRGWGLMPKKGSVEPWLKLCRFIFNSTEPGMLEWFWDWCAYPIQNPGVKMFSAVVIHGVAQGTGKTLIGYTLAKIYGENFKEITDDDLEETYWAENKQFILGDEVSGKDNRQYMNTLKRLITKESIDINIKFVPQYELPNCMNFLFTSQHGDSFFLEDKDRRFMVVEVQDDPMPEKFYTDYDRWYKKEGGCQALFQWLLDRKISKDFNPAGHAPRTAAKERMIAATKGDAGAWVHDLKQHPEQILRMGQMVFTRDIFSARELLNMYEAEHPNGKLTAVGLGRQLSTAGFVQVLDGKPLLNPNSGKMERMFAVRNVHHWKQVKDRKKIERNLQLSPKKGAAK